MAKIAFFTESFPKPGDLISGFSYELIRGLADQQHEIKLFSTYRDDNEPTEVHPRIEVLRPFRKWSWLEVPRILPILMNFRPDVIHFIQPHRESIEGWTNAMTLLPAMGPFLGDTLTVVSLYDLPKDPGLQVRTLLQGCQIITVPNQRLKEQLRPLIVGGRRIPKIEILPTTGAALPATGALLDPAFDEFLSSGDSIVVFPGDVDQHQNGKVLFDLIHEILTRRPESRVALVGGWGSTPVRLRHDWMLNLHEPELARRFFMTGAVGASVLSEAIRRARLTPLVTLRAESLFFTFAIRLGLRTGGALVVSTTQLEDETLKLEDGSSAHLRSPTLAQAADFLSDLLDRSPVDDQTLRDLAAELAARETTDLPGNMMSRLYQFR